MKARARRLNSGPDSAAPHCDVHGRNTAATVVPRIIHDVIGTPGHPLDRSTREFMEPRFGHDFSGIRVHTDSRAAESAAAVQARAYTVGHEIVFGAGQFAPASGRGRNLLAHELAHTMQQSRARIGAARPDTIRMSRLADAGERQADAVADRVAAGTFAPSDLGTGSAAAHGGALLQRQFDDRKPLPIVPFKKKPDTKKPETLKSKMFAGTTFTYTVQPGDNLSKIALKYLGAASKSTEIYEENRDVIGDDPGSIEVGMQLTVHSPVAVGSAKQAIYSALDPKGGVLIVKGEALEYLKDHATTRKLRADFEKDLKAKVTEYLQSGSPLSSFADIYRQQTVSAYGGNPHKPEDWLSTGTWLIGHVFPEVRYTVSWTGDSKSGWTATWAAVWVLNDNLDLGGGAGHSSLYNKVSVPAQEAWNVMLGGRRNAPLQATWKDGGTVTIAPTSPQPVAPKSFIPMSPEALVNDKTVVAMPGSVLGMLEEMKNKPWIIGGSWTTGGALGRSELNAAKAFYTSESANYTNEEIQRIRAKLGLPNGEIDDKFLQAVALYQRNAGLMADGMAGEKTLAHMFGTRFVPRRLHD
jgi:hypothetical protein